MLGTFSEHPVEVKAGTKLAADPRPAPRQRAVEPPPGRRAPGGGARRDRLGRGRVARGARGPDRRFAVGVLWHPEMEEDKRLFEALVDEARRYRAERYRAERSAARVAEHTA